MGVVHDGAVVLAEAWGYADLARRRPMTTRTLLPICSISKQFTCGVLLDLVGDPSRLDDRVGAFLPRLEGRRPSVAELCHMQSGLRDYWALTVLHGAQPEGVFAREDARPLIARMRTTHFAPGTSYSYCNANFRMLSDIIEDHAGRSLGELYAERMFGPAGMETAVLAPDTSAPPEGIVGYEGNAEVGFFPATNRIYWTGDAGLAASLEDMLAWERHIDATRDDAESLYRRLSVAPRFADGTPARYGYGLVHETVAGLGATGHGGALRGFRLQRLIVPARRLSVVVLFNHEGDAHAAALSVMRAALGDAGEPAGAAVEAGWAGAYLDPATDLVLRVEPRARRPRGLVRDRPGPPGGRGRRRGAGTRRDAGPRRRRDADGAARGEPADDRDAAVGGGEGGHRGTLPLGGARRVARGRDDRQRLLRRVRGIARQRSDAPGPSARGGRLAPVLSAVDGRAASRRLDGPGAARRQRRGARPHGRLLARPARGVRAGGLTRPPGGSVRVPVPEAWPFFDAATALGGRTIPGSAALWGHAPTARRGREPAGPRGPECTVGRSPPRRAPAYRTGPMLAPTPVAGIDVGKSFLDLGFEPAAKPLRVRDDPAGIAALIEALRRRGATRITLEAIGPYAWPLTAALVAAAATGP